MNHRRSKLQNLLSLLPMLFLAVSLTPTTVCMDGEAKRVTVRLKTQSGKDSEHRKKGNHSEQKRNDHSEYLLISPADSAEFRSLNEKVRFSGFDKPANSRKETFLISNESEFTLTGIDLRIVYSDLSGRMLHSRDEHIELRIPPGDTRQAVIKSFDPQGTLYYYESRQPKKGGQPFKVSIAIISALISDM